MTAQALPRHGGHTAILYKLAERAAAKDKGWCYYSQAALLHDIARPPFGVKISRSQLNVWLSALEGQGYFGRTRRHQADQENKVRFRPTMFTLKAPLMAVVHTLITLGSDAKHYVKSGASRLARWLAPRIDYITARSPRWAVFFGLSRVRGFGQCSSPLRGGRASRVFHPTDMAPSSSAPTPPQPLPRKGLAEEVREEKARPTGEELRFVYDTAAFGLAHHCLEAGHEVRTSSNGVVRCFTCREQLYTFPRSKWPPDQPAAPSGLSLFERLGIMKPRTA